MTRAIASNTQTKTLASVLFSLFLFFFCGNHKDPKYPGRELNLVHFLSHHFVHGLCLSHISLATALVTLLCFLHSSDSVMPHEKIDGELIKPFQLGIESLRKEWDEELT